MLSRGGSPETANVASNGDVSRSTGFSGQASAPLPPCFSLRPRTPSFHISDPALSTPGSLASHSPPQYLLRPVSRWSDRKAESLSESDDISFARHSSIFGTPPLRDSTPPPLLSPRTPPYPLYPRPYSFPSNSQRNVTWADGLNESDNMSVNSSAWSRRALSLQSWPSFQAPAPIPIAPRRAQSLDTVERRHRGTQEPVPHPKLSSSATHSEIPSDMQGSSYLNCGECILRRLVK